MRGLTCKHKTSDKKLAKCRLILLSYDISIILKLKGDIKRRLISKLSKKSIKRFQDYSLIC